MTLNKKTIKCSRDYNKGQFATLEEGKDYSIQVSKSTVDHKKCVASITCKCGKAYKITEKPTGERIITNWSKHLKKCEYKKDQSIQHSLQNYFVSPATAATTLTTTTITGGAAAEPCLTDSNATDQSDQSILESLLFTPLNELPISSADPSDTTFNFSVNIHKFSTTFTCNFCKFQQSSNTNSCTLSCYKCY